MAQLTSHIASVIRGSVGGITFYSHKELAIAARAKVYPTLVNSNALQAGKAAFCTAVQQWQDTTDAVRKGWNDYARGLRKAHPTGTRGVDGRHAFISALCFAHFCYDQGWIIDFPLFSYPEAFGPMSMFMLGPRPLTDPGIGAQWRGYNNSDQNIVVVASHGPPYALARNYDNKLSDPQTYVAQTVNSLSFYDIQFGDCRLNACYFAKIRAITFDSPFRVSPVYRYRFIPNEVEA